MTSRRLKAVWADDDGLWIHGQAVLVHRPFKERLFICRVPFPEERYAAMPQRL